MKSRLVLVFMSILGGLLLAQGGISGTGQISVQNLPPIHLYGAPVQFSLVINLSGVSSPLETVGLGGFVVPVGFDTSVLYFDSAKSVDLPGDQSANPPTLTFVNTDPSIANANGFFAVVGATSVSSVGPSYSAAKVTAFPKQMGTIALDLTSPQGAPAQVSLSLSSKWTDSNGGPANIPASAVDTSFTVTGKSILASGDYDGDGKSDLVVYDPQNATWWIRFNNGSYDFKIWGGGANIPVPGDYDGDGLTNVAVYDPEGYNWWILKPSGAYDFIGWGGPNSIPVPGNYSGTSITDIAIYDTSTYYWWIRYGSNSWEAISWGGPGAIPVPGNYLGTGTQVAIYDPATYIWWIRHSDGSYDAIGWGAPGVIPVPADYNNDGITEIAIYDPSTFTWWIRYNNGSYDAVSWGGPGAIPIPMNFSGTGSKISIYDPATYSWWIRNQDGSYDYIGWGAPNLIALAK